MNSIRQLLARIRRDGILRAGVVKTTSMGREREFYAWDLDEDTFIFERGISQHLDERPSVLVTRKDSLEKGTVGWVMTMTSGNHSVAAFPLLDGRFWKMSKLPSAKRSEVLINEILCANVVSETIELSQREVDSNQLYKADEWLTGTAGLTIADVVMIDRNEEVLHHFRARGQEWRVKPLAWSEGEMKVALAASVKHISTKLNYFHSVRGVHFLTYPEFVRFVQMAQTEPKEFKCALRELVAVFEGNQESFMRMVKHRGHHEVELFGLPRGQAEKRLVPELENLMAGIELGRLNDQQVYETAEGIRKNFESLLIRHEMADESSCDFIETLYMFITGEIYAVVGDGTSQAFDDRRTALPGATFVNGVPTFHPNADERTHILLSNMRNLTSKDEIVEYANVYEIREETSALGKGSTREIVYKTNRGPLEISKIEKRLSHHTGGYGSYMLARIGALKALGIHLSDYRLLRQHGENGGTPYDFYIRQRCDGEPLFSIPKNYFCNIDDTSLEARDAVLGVAMLMGDAAAQNMAMKKYDPVKKSALYGIGKEIYSFEFDVAESRVTPKTVSICSVRGSFGWPCLDLTEENIHEICIFYCHAYAETLIAFGKQHQVDMTALVEAFMNGFEHRTHAMAWNFSVLRDQFEKFDPNLPRRYEFAKKWRFVMWSLERQERRLLTIRELFNSLVKNGEVKNG